MRVSTDMREATGTSEQPEQKDDPLRGIVDELRKVSKAIDDLNRHRRFEKMQDSWLTRIAQKPTDWVKWAAIAAIVATLSSVISAIAAIASAVIAYQGLK